MPNNSQKKSGVVRRYLLPALLLGTTIFVVAVLVLWNARFTVSSGEKSDDLGYFKYGYKIEQSYFRNSFRLTFWSSRGMEFVHSEGQVTVAEIVEQRWLKNDAAIYLNLRLKYHDSIVSEGPARMIFDFHRGEIYVSSGYTLWRNFDNKHSHKDWMSDAEFDAVLSRLSEQRSNRNCPAIWFAPINDPINPRLGVTAAGGEGGCFCRGTDIQTAVRELPLDKLERLGEMLAELKEERK